MFWPLPKTYPITNDEDAHVARGSGLAVDLAAPPGTPWRACADATVKVNQYDAAAGWMVWLQWFDGASDTLFRARYCHGDQPSPLAVGAEVTAGQVIGWVGDTASGQTGTSTGPHLHFVLERYPGQWERLKPSDWLDRSAEVADAADGSDTAEITTPEDEMQSVVDSLNKAWTLLTAIQQEVVSQAVLDLAEEVKVQIVEVKKSVGLQ